LIPSLQLGAEFNAGVEEVNPLLTWFLASFGASIDLGHGLALRYMNDGTRSHGLLDVSRNNAGISLMWIWMETFGVAFFGGF